MSNDLAHNFNCHNCFNHFYCHIWFSVLCQIFLCRNYDFFFITDFPKHFFLLQKCSPIRKCERDCCAKPASTAHRPEQDLFQESFMSYSAETTKQYKGWDDIGALKMKSLFGRSLECDKPHLSHRCSMFQLIQTACFEGNECVVWESIFECLFALGWGQVAVKVLCRSNQIPDIRWRQDFLTGLSLSPCWPERVNADLKCIKPFRKKTLIFM